MRNSAARASASLNAPDPEALLRRTYRSKISDPSFFTRTTFIPIAPPLPRIFTSIVPTVLSPIETPAVRNERIAEPWPLTSNDEAFSLVPRNDQSVAL